MLRAAALALVLAASPVPDPKVDGTTPVVATVDRIAGPDRYGTAAAIARTIDDDTVMVATGESFPDALVAAGTGHPVLLVTRDAVPPATAAELARRAPAHVVVVGGPAAVSDAVLHAVGAETRVAGQDRYETAASLVGLRDAYVADGRSFAEAAPVAAAAVRDGRALRLVDHPVDPPPALDVDALVLASDGSFADALTAATLGRTLLLVPARCVPERTIDAIEAATPSRITLVGGTGAIADAVGELRSCALPDTVVYELGADLSLAQQAYVRAAVDATRRRWGDPGPLLVQAYADTDALVEASVRARGGTAEDWRRWWGEASGYGSHGWIGLHVGQALGRRGATSASFLGLVAHEVAHALEFRDGVVDAPEWLVEGCAERMATDVAVAEGWYAGDDEARRLAWARRITGSLESYEVEGDDGGEYHLGWAGCTYLTDLAGDGAVADLFGRIAAGAGWEDALEQVTGMRPGRFYDRFAPWLAAQ